jgi:hypothetical protein
MSLTSPMLAFIRIQIELLCPIMCDLVKMSSQFHAPLTFDSGVRYSMHRRKGEPQKEPLCARRKFQFSVSNRRKIRENLVGEYWYYCSFHAQNKQDLICLLAIAFPVNGF